MTPNFRIETNGRDLTARIRERMLRLTVKDEAGLKSDSMSLELADDPPIEWPADGQVFDVALGYDDSLTSVGRFATRHIAVSASPERVLKIEAAAMEQYGSLRNQREESWDQTTLGAIASEIARRNGLKPSVFDNLNSITIDHEDQTESDLAFLCRLGRRHDLTVKVSGRYLLIAPADKSAAAGGRIPTVTVTNPLRFEYSGDQTIKYTGVRAFWYDVAAGKKNHVLYGKEGVVLELEFNKISESAARKAAEAKFREVVRRGRSLGFTVPGNTSLAAERNVFVLGFSSGIDGSWVIKSVEHIMDGSGFVSIVECSLYAAD